MGWGEPIAARSELSVWKDEARLQCERAVAAETRLRQAEALLRRASVIFKDQNCPVTRAKIDAFLAAAGGSAR